MATTNNRYDDFDRLVQRHRSYIRRLCWWHASGRSEDCADLMQDCLAALWHFRHTLRPDASPAQERLWVKYHCRSVFSHRKRRWEPQFTPLDEDRLPAEEPPDNRAVIEELACNLSDRERHILDLILDGYSRSEIAALLDLKAGTVTQIRFRIIEKMKQELK
jgi:RNA polymerase sigma factor (sigma-70 family)